MLFKQSHIRLLIGIADTGKLQAAADICAISQPAASRILAELETQAKGSLFERHPKGMIPTLLGEVFIRHARALDSEIDNLCADVDDLNTGRAGEVRVGSVTGPTVGCLVPALRKLKSASPDVEATIEVGTSAQLFRGLQEGRFDFILARPPSDYDTRGFRILPARAEIVSLVVHHSHPLRTANNITLKSLIDFEWVIQERGSPIRSAVENAFHSQGIETPRNITNSSSLLVMLSMIQNSETIAPLTSEVAELLMQNDMSPGLATLDLTEVIKVTPYFIIHDRNRELPLVAKTLMDEVIIRL